MQEEWRPGAFFRTNLDSENGEGYFLMMHVRFTQIDRTELGFDPTPECMTDAVAKQYLLDELGVEVSELECLSVCSEYT